MRRPKRCGGVRAHRPSGCNFSYCDGHVGRSDCNPYGTRWDRENRTRVRSCPPPATNDR
ncbi:H-X9-DG-CTERM domain-containing protein [Rhizobium redzepovicii]|uniref:H-X9-DG-CTERM domain-containing protein n=1 Tax=Rhizobium TaxID=379 RepID=UPI003CCEBA76